MDDAFNNAGRLERLERRDWHLWSIALLVILALTSTILGIYTPQLFGA